METVDPDSPGLRVVQVVREFSTCGGVETVAVQLQAAWEQAGFPSDVLAGSVDPAVCAGLTRVRTLLPRLNLAWVPTRGRWRHAGRAIVVPWFTLLASAALWAARWRGGWAEGALILSHGDSLVADVIVLHAVNAANLAQKRRDGEWRWALNPMTWFVEARDRLMLRGLRARRYVAVSQRLVDEVAALQGIPPERVTVIPNGTDVDRFTPLGPKAAFRAEFTIPDAAVLLLFAGNEFARKGLAHVIGALAQPGCEAAHLVVVGADDPAPYARLAAQARAGERVHFAGPRRDMPDVYRAADAFVLPTAYESFSLVCMEAMASGVPVFAARTGGIEDYLQDGVNGYFVERNPASIAAALAPVIADRSRLVPLGVAARNTALGFAWPEVATRYRLLLSQVWRETRSPLRATPERSDAR